jgi:hypothetical protein
MGVRIPAPGSELNAKRIRLLHRLAKRAIMIHVATQTVPGRGGIAMTNETMTEDEIRELVKQAKTIDVVLGDWPEGEVARTVIYEDVDGRIMAVDWKRVIMGDQDEEWPGQPYPVRKVETEKVITVRSWERIES